MNTILKGNFLSPFILILWLKTILGQSIDVSDIGTSVNSAKSATINNSINIGLILSPANGSPNLERRRDILLRGIQNELDKVNEIFSNLRPPGEGPIYRLELITASLVPNPIEMSRYLCQEFIGNKTKGGVSSVIIDTADRNYLASITSISFTLGLYNIPVIGTTLRDSSLFSKNIHSSFISMIPPYSHQADVWLSLMKRFNFKKSFILTSWENQNLLSRFVELVDQQVKASKLDKSEPNLEANIGGSFDEEEFKIEAVIEYDSASYLNSNSAWQDVSGKIMNLLSNSICRVFLIHAQSLEDVEFFLNLVNNLNLTQEGFALILSEEFLELAMNNNLEIPNGVISSKLDQSFPIQSGSGDNNKLNSDPSIAYALDSLALIIEGLKEILEFKSSKQLTFEEAPDSCFRNPAIDWQTGLELYENMLRKRFKALTGQIAFDENGDRFTANYNLLNFFSQINSEAEQLKTIGSIRNEQNSSEINLNISAIQWPGGIFGKLISGLYINQNLKIVTMEEKPFVWVLRNETKCWSNKSNNIHYERELNHFLVGCRRPDSETKFCCKGYCMDLLVELANRLNFSFDLYLADDGQYGSFESPPNYWSPANDSQANVMAQQPWGVLSKLSSLLRFDSSEIQEAQQDDLESDQQTSSQQQQQAKPKWTGLIGELVSRRADMAFAPLTITPARAQVVDFSKPFKFHGFSILLRRASKHTTLASFLQPFQNQLWILVIGVATHVVALSLYLLDRYSAFGRFGIRRNYFPKSSDSQEPNVVAGDKPLHWSSSLWFSWSILLNSGVGEHTPRSLAGRFLGIVWSGFAMIVVASYTANLAAFLVLDTREEKPAVTGIDDPRLRSGEMTLNFATVKGSPVDSYLQSQVEFVNLYRKMEEFNFETIDRLIEALRRNTIDALIWDSTRLEWEVANDEECSLAIAGELFGSSGYGIGLQKGSYWTKNLTTKLLELHESGFMIELDKKWIGQQAAGSALVGQSCSSRPEDAQPETLGVGNIAGVFVLFACGLLTSFGLIYVERLCHKHRGKLISLRRRVCKCF